MSHKGHQIDNPLLEQITTISRNKGNCSFNVNRDYVKILKLCRKVESLRNILQLYKLLYSCNNISRGCMVNLSMFLILFLIYLKTAENENSGKIQLLETIRFIF